MIDRLVPSSFDRRLLGGPPLRGPTPWVVAIMSFSILLIAALGLGLANMAGRLGNSIESRYSIQLTGDDRNSALVAGALRRTPGVSRVEEVPQHEMRRTLERWLGPEAANSELPVPALVNFDFGQGADTIAVKHMASAIDPSARLIAHRDSVGGLLDSMRLLQWVSLGLVILLAGAAAAAVVLAARAALGSHRFTIQVMHGIGATDRQITNLFQRKIAIDSLVGSVAGAVAGGIILLLLAAGARFAGQFSGGMILGSADYLILLLLPFALTVLATGVARAAVLGALREDL